MSGQWLVDSGQKDAANSGQWTVDSGQWTVDRKLRVTTIIFYNT